MKIAHVTPVFPPYKSGMGNAVFLQCRELSGLGCDVTVLTTQSENRKVESDKIEGIKLNQLCSFVRYGNASVAPQLLRHMRGYDVVHLHYPFFGGAEWVWLAKKLGIIKKLVVYYHMDAHIEGLLGKATKAYEQFVLPKLLKVSDLVLVSSIDYVNHSKFSQLFNSQSVVKKIREVALGVEIEKFQISNFKFQIQDLRNKLHINKEQKIVLFVGGMDKAHYFKGVDVLLRAFAHYISLDAKGSEKGRGSLLVLVGSGNKSEEYKRLSRELGISREVIFAENVSDDELPVYYHMSDVTVLPSINSAEAFGIVLIEAMACGRAVIASDLPGVRTVIENDVNGYLVKPGDANALAEKILHILNDPENAREMGDRGREKVVEKYEMKKIGIKLRDIYSLL